MPKVSVCIPTYNHPELVSRALNSVIEQDYDDYEVIITDDSEGNAISELISGISDKRIHYYKNATRLGSPANWNCAISLAKGEYIKILHHDDWFSDRNCLFQFVKLLDENPNSVLGFSSSFACRSGDIVSVNTPSIAELEELSINPASLFFGNCIGAPSATIFRNDNHVSFDEDLKWLVDIDFYITILSTYGKSYAYIKKPLICVTFEGEHQVTNECLGNKNIEIFENILLFNKIRKMQCKLSILKFLVFFSDLLNRFRITTLSELCNLAKNQKITSLHKLALVFCIFRFRLRKVKQLTKGWHISFREGKS